MAERIKAKETYFKKHLPILIGLLFVLSSETCLPEPVQQYFTNPTRIEYVAPSGGVTALDFLLKKKLPPHKSHFHHNLFSIYRFTLVGYQQRVLVQLKASARTFTNAHHTPLFLQRNKSTLRPSSDEIPLLLG